MDAELCGNAFWVLLLGIGGYISAAYWPQYHAENFECRKDHVQDGCKWPSDHARAESR